MSRKTLWSVVALFAVTGIMVMVRAQDSSTQRTSLADRLKAIRQGVSAESGDEDAPANSSSDNTQNSILRRRINDEPATPAKPPGSPPISTGIPTPVNRSFDTSTNDSSQFRPRTPTPITKTGTTAPAVSKSPIAPVVTPTVAPDENRQAVLPGRIVGSPVNSSNFGSASSRRAERMPSISSSPIAEPDDELAQPPQQLNTTVPSSQFDSNNDDRFANRSTAKTNTAANEEQIEIKSLGPVLRVHATGPGAITIGKPAMFVVHASNLSNETARSVVVGIRLPEWVEILGNKTTEGTVGQQADAQNAARLVWSIDRLAGRGESELTLTLMAKESRPIDLGLDWVFRPESTSARIVVQEPRLQLALSGPVDVLYGDDTKYTITVANPGTGDAENVSVNLPPEFGGGQKVIGTIAAGERQQFEVPLVARQSGEVAIRVQAIADGGLRNESTHHVLIRRAALAVQVAGPNFKYAGSVVKYQLKVTNVGDAIAQDVLAAAALPAGATYVGGVQGAEQVDGGLRWPIGQLSPGAERYYEISCELTQAGQNEFQAGARAEGDISAANSVATTVEALADLKLRVNDPQGPKPVGEHVVYELKISNRGTKAANNVNIVMQFSEGVEPVEVEGGRAELVPGQVLFENIERIDAGTEVTLTIKARADKAGNHVYRTVVSCPDPETRRVSEGTTRFFADETPTTANREFEPTKR